MLLIMAARGFWDPPDPTGNCTGSGGGVGGPAGPTGLPSTRTAVASGMSETSVLATGDIQAGLDSLFFWPCFFALFFLFF